MMLLRVFLLLAAAPLAATEFPFNPFKMMPAFGAILGLTGGGRRTYPFPAGAACKADLKSQCKSIVRVCETGDEVRSTQYGGPPPLFSLPLRLHTLRAVFHNPKLRHHTMRCHKGRRQCFVPGFVSSDALCVVPYESDVRRHKGRL